MKTTACADPAPDTAPRVLIVHNAYQQRGGEDSVVEAEAALLRDRGHAVEIYARHNREIEAASRLGLAQETLWSERTVSDIGRLVQTFQPALIHVHNTFPLISPSLYWAASRHRMPVVQTLHNFRLLCPQAMFLRQGRICEDCLGHLPWRGAMRGCYRDSVAQTTVLTGMLGLHRLLRTYSSKVTRYIALNEFCRGKFVAGGLPAEKISVKPNFVDIADRSGDARAGGLFVGRLSPEKGIDTLLRALDRLPAMRLSVIGSGPEQAAVERHPGVSARGAVPPDGVAAAMRAASWLVMPSVWYENFPRTLVEAFACRLPVIASRLGAMAELVEDGVTGLLFEPGDAQDLAAKMAWAQQHPQQMRTMGDNARRRFDAHYTPEINYRQLMAIYRQAIAETESA